MSELLTVVTLILGLIIGNSLAFALLLGDSSFGFNPGEFLAFAFLCLTIRYRSKNSLLPFPFRDSLYEMKQFHS